MNDEIIFGIDLGTTNSLIAWVKDAKPECLRLVHGSETLLPSVVRLGVDSVVVGEDARADAGNFPWQTFFSTKRLLGKSFAEAAPLLQRLGPVAHADEQGRLYFAHPLFGRTTPLEIARDILAEIKKRAEALTEIEVKNVVITVPAYFNDEQRQLTRFAGRLAGLNVLRIINEPTAAALAYGFHGDQNHSVAVFDLGGGTFDVSILRIEAGVFEVLATAGDTALGGDDIDQAIIQFVTPELEAFFSVLPSETEIRAAAEKTKRQNDQGQTTFTLTHLGKTFVRRISLAEMASICQPIIERMNAIGDRAFEDAQITPADCAALLLVGGPTRMTVLQAGIGKHFSHVPKTHLHPDEAIALGAAIQGEILAGRLHSHLLLDVVPLSLGIENYGDLTSVLIPRNAKIPTVVSEQYTTFVDQQTAIDIHVLQGESAYASQNRSIARFKLGGLAPEPAGYGRIQVQFLIDADGILQVEAKDLKTGKIASTEVRPTFGLTEAEKNALLYPSDALSLAHRQWSEVLHAALRVVREIEKRLPEAPAFLTPPEIESLTGKLRRMREEMDAKNPEAVQNLRYELEADAKQLAEKLLVKTLRHL